MSEVPANIDLIITMLSSAGASSHVQVTRALAGIVKLHQQQIAALMGNQPSSAGSPGANGDLSDEELKCVLARACCAKGPCPNCSCRAGRELHRLRAAQVASKERVREVVWGCVLDVALTGPRLSTQTLQMLAAAIASRVADQLATPAVLSAEERASLESAILAVEYQIGGGTKPHALLLRLLGGKP